jgi:hypothetical protein
MRESRLPRATGVAASAPSTLRRRLYRRSFARAFVGNTTRVPRLVVLFDGGVRKPVSVGDKRGLGFVVESIDTDAGNPALGRMVNAAVAGCMPEEGLEPPTRGL